MVDGLADHFPSFLLIHAAVAGLQQAHLSLLSYSSHRAPFALHASILTCQRVHKRRGYTQKPVSRVCTPPEDDLQSIDLAAHRLEHDKGVVYVQAAGVHCQREQRLVLGRWKTPREFRHLRRKSSLFNRQAHGDSRRMRNRLQAGFVRGVGKVVHAASMKMGRGRAGPCYTFQ